MSRATEDYLKTIYHLTTRGEVVTTGQLARELGVSSPSVSAMVKRLEDGESRRPPRSAVPAAHRLRRAGRAARRPPPPAAGDVPVPGCRGAVGRGARRGRAARARALASGSRSGSTPRWATPPTIRTAIRSRRAPVTTTSDWGTPLDAVPAMSRFRVQRVSDRDSAALRHLGKLGVVPGAEIDVADQEPVRWAALGRRRRHRHALGGPLTRLVHGNVLARHRAHTTATMTSTDRTRSTCRRSGGWGRLRYFGPAFVAAIAYVDPGNFATNFSAGAEYGYLLLWVIVAANLMAMLDPDPVGQAGHGHRPQPAGELCREQFPRPSPAACGCRPSSSRSPPTSPR